MLIRIDHKLRVARSQLPREILNLIVEALTIPNIQRQKAMEQGIQGWRDMPESIPLYEWDKISQFLTMPRGFIKNLAWGLDQMGIRWEFDDQRIFENDLSPMGPSRSIHLRDWQVPAVHAIINHEQGIWKAPAGSGKTVAVLEAIRRLNCPSIVVVNTLDILYQWEQRAEQFLGKDFPVGVIGDGKFEVSDYLTIATAQTLSSRFEKLKRDGFFEQFSFFCLDECHHATADTYSTIVDSFASRYRIGVSATPDKTGDFALAENILGPIFHVTDPKDVKTLVRPIIFKIPTRFEFEYKGREGRRPSNYPQLLERLINDPWRNYLIAKSVMLNVSGHSLIVSKRLDHLSNLMIELERQDYPHLIMKLTGNESSETRRLVIEQANKAPCVILSTLADEALDIPRLDRIFLVFPQRNPGLIEQQIGRLGRQAPGKTDAAVLDFADVLVGPLDAQWKARRVNVYQQHGYEIQIVRAQEITNFDLDA